MGDEAFKVQGALAVVLRLSRVLGLAPLYFAHDRGGYIVTVSRLAAVYGYILTFCTHICEVTFSYKNTAKFYRDHSSFLDGGFIKIIATMFVTGVGSYGSIYRMKNIARHSNLLNKIHYDLSGKSDMNRTKSLFAVINTILTILLIGVLAIFKYITFSKSRLEMAVFDFVIYIEFYKIYLLFMENAFINFDVCYTVYTMRLKLREWVDKSNSYNISEAACCSSLTRFRDLMKAYVSVCDVVKGLSAIRGGIMFILFSANSLFLAMTFFNFIDYYYLTSKLRYHTVVLCIQVLWCVYHLFMAVLFIEPWHQISAQLTDIRILFIKLNLNVTSVGKSIPLELDLMFKQLLLNQPTMSPLDLVTIQRSLLTATISFVTTYFVIMVQYVRNRREK